MTRRWFWPSFAFPGAIWLVLFFLVPTYAVVAVAFGTVDPIFQQPVPIWNPLHWQFGGMRSVLSGLLFGTLGFAGFALGSRGWMMLAVIPLIALWGIAAPAMQSLMSRRVDPSSQGKLQGAINSLRAVTGMAGPVLFTQVFAVAISPRFGLHLAGAPYFLAALLLLSSLLLAVYVTRPSEGEQSSPQAATDLNPSE